MSEVSKRDAVEDLNDSREEAPKKKARIASLIDDQAAESGSEHGSDSESEEDENQYDTRDGFVVHDNSDESEPESDSDADSDDGGESKRKPALKNLKRKKEGTKVDLDELEMIRENLEDEGRDTQQDKEGEEDEDDEIAPETVHEHELDGTLDKRDDYGEDEDVDSEDEMNGFIVDDVQEGEAAETEEERAERRALKAEERAARKKMEGARAGGPTRQQLEDVMEIFGDGYDEFGDYSDAEEEEEDEDGNLMIGAEAGAAASAMEKKKLDKIRSTFEHTDLVKSFCTAEDDVIRATDIPERLQYWMKRRALPGPGPDAAVSDQSDLLLPEANWVCTKLVNKIYDERGHEVSTNRFSKLSKAELQKELLTPVLEVLKLLLVEHMEVPFIATYRKDYIHPLLTSRYLWHILNLDEQYADFIAQREKLLMEYQVFNEVAVQLKAGEGVVYHNAVAEELEEALQRHGDLVAQHEVASAALDRCMDVVEAEDASDADREHVVEAEARVESLVQQIAGTEAVLQSCKDRAVAEQKKKRIFDAVDHIAVVQVMELMPFNKYENMIRFCEDESQLVDIRNFMQLLEHGSTKSQIKVQRAPKAVSSVSTSSASAASAASYDNEKEGLSSSNGVLGGRMLSTTAGTSVSRTGRIIKKQAVTIANDSEEDDDDDFVPEPEGDADGDAEAGEAEADGAATNVHTDNENLFGEDDDEEVDGAAVDRSSVRPDESQMSSSADDHRVSSETVVSKQSQNLRKRLSRATAKDAYYKVRQIPGVREFASLFTVSATQCGQCLRYGESFKTECATPVDSVESLALRYMEIANEGSDALMSNDMDIDSGLQEGQKKLHFLSVDEFIKAVKTLVAIELANEPSVRERARDKYRSGATVSTFPTTKGTAEIHPFHELFGISLLHHKPVYELLHDPSDRSLFLKLLKAETDGLITVKINPPPLRDASGRATDSSEMYIEHMLPVYMPSIRADMDVNPETRAAWDTMRMSVLSECLERYLTPQLEAETRRELVRLSREAVVEECADKFASMLKVGPYRYDPKAVADPNAWGAPPGAAEANLALSASAETAKVLLDCPPERKFKCSVLSFFLPQAAGREDVGLCYMDEDGVVRAQSVLPVEAAKNAMMEWVKKYLSKYKPPLIIINSSGGKAAIALQNKLTRSVIAEVSRQSQEEIRQRKFEREDAGDFGDYSEYDHMNTEYTAQVLIVDDAIAQIFKRSSRSTDLFPEYYPAVCGAICMARYVLEPLTEFCGMWQSVDSLGNFGYEALFLNLHPLKVRLWLFLVLIGSGLLCAAL